MRSFRTVKYFPFPHPTSAMQAPPGNSSRKFFTFGHTANLQKKYVLLLHILFFAELWRPKVFQMPGLLARELNVGPRGSNPWLLTNVRFLYSVPSGRGAFPSSTNESSLPWQCYDHIWIILHKLHAWTFCSRINCYRKQFNLCRKRKPSVECYIFVGNILCLHLRSYLPFIKHRKTSWFAATHWSLQSSFRCSVCSICSTETNR